MSEAITTARPYAQAAFEAAQKHNDLSGWSDFLQLGAEAVANSDVRVAISSPRVNDKQREDLMLSLSKAKSGSAQVNFTKLLVENQRLEILPEIAGLYEILKAEAEKSLEVTVTSAFELSEPQKQKISVSLKRRLNKEIRLQCVVDKQLLGGVVIRAGDKVIDGSAKSRLTEMAVALA